MVRRLLVVVLITLATGPAAAAQDAPAARTLTGSVIDAMGGAIGGAVLTLRTAAGSRTAVTASDGSFVFDSVPAGPATLVVTFDLFEAKTIELSRFDRPVRVVMDPLGITEAVQVEGDLVQRRTVIATRTSTPLRDVPQSVSTVTRDLITDTGMRGMADAVSFVPGVGMAQGEGHRDAPIFRGNTSTSDFYVDGLRDDTQYLRDLYNIDRVEVLKGPNGMMFGRGGVGGVINRVTRLADGTAPRELSVNAGAFEQRRVSGDLGHAFTSAASGRLTAMYENSGTHRAGVNIDRMGINPSFALSFGNGTRLTANYEYFRDDRTVDRGVPSFQGRPLETDPSTFFGNADRNTSDVTVNAVSALFETRLAGRIILRNNSRVADYDKFYANLVPGAVNAAKTTVALSGYNSTTTRQNVFNQTDVILSQRTGGVNHTVLAGAEFGRQRTSNLRLTAFFPSISATTTSVTLPLSDPTTTLPVEFRSSATDANNRGVATVAALYAQDQMALSPHLQVVVGLRYDKFAVDLTDHRTATEFSSRDGLLSPRAAVIYKPVVPVSLYASYTRAYLPRAGEQLASLSLTTEALDPENFRNYEVGAKWDVNPALALTAALYHTNRGNVVVRDALDPTVSHLVDGERSRGLELEISGRVNGRWSLQGGYAHQNAEILASTSPTILAGAWLAQVPRHSFSLWNRYEAHRFIAVGLGVVSMSDRFVATDNTVVLPSFTRVDSAVYFRLTPQLRAQVNIENLLDTRYWSSAHSNNNIAPGAPRAVRVGLTTRF